jgi:hypothetical protein
MHGYSQVFKGEAHPREAHTIASHYAWGIGPLLQAVQADQARLPPPPNPPAAPRTRLFPLSRMALGPAMPPRRHVDPTAGGVVFPG